MAQYKIPDPEELTPCPYDKVHMIRAKRMQYHLMKCRKNYAGRDFATCPFNARHEMPKPELRYHLANCPDKALIEPMLAYENSKKNGEEGSMFKGNTDLPVYENLNINSEENWDAEIPSVARIGVDPQFLAKQDHMIIPGLTKSEKREFVKQMNIPAEDRKYVAHYTETREEDLTLKDEQPKLRLPKTAAQTYLPHQRKSFQQPSTVFAYSLSMAGVGRGLPVTGAEGGAQNERPGLSRGRGRGFTPAMGRGATIAEMNGHVPQSIGRGMAYYNGDAPSTIQKSSAAVKPEVLSTTPVFNVGIGRGVPNGISSPPSFVVPTLPQQNGHASVKKEEDDAEDFGKKLKKLEKKIRQINLLEEKVEEEGYTLSAEEVAKVGLKGQLLSERDDLLEKMG
ncbi:uncharacterized protein LOC125683191 isoform X2 [Ostrea edulis]|uniref:uncharacterized protein LOC125683191 isoform X2 n=1 Tax=Ostrea edulis TaxID=37623 RepID=UPI0024AF0304|nr:uncharacterized protein LOC125683191 isoform X2 [Ostrea edulis]